MKRAYYSFLFAGSLLAATALTSCGSDSTTGVESESTTEQGGDMTEGDMNSGTQTPTDTAGTMGTTTTGGTTGTTGTTTGGTTGTTGTTTGTTGTTTGTTTGGSTTGGSTTGGGSGTTTGGH
ncbi:hypothetical protein POKO110462_23140 [Pontibacter korlensis]|uniref:hypothetical protein n=1 Tax=Pontibacter korlensis TaxID=400092 RepID=UPI00061B3BC3|nr:hypothetical protein [Pontibacter korlensis]